MATDRTQWQGSSARRFFRLGLIAPALSLVLLAAVGGSGLLRLFTGQDLVTELFLGLMFFGPATLTGQLALSRLRPAVEGLADLRRREELLLTELEPDRLIEIRLLGRLRNLFLASRVYTPMTVWTAVVLSNVHAWHGSSAILEAFGSLLFQIGYETWIRMALIDQLIWLCKARNAARRRSLATVMWNVLAAGLPPGLLIMRLVSHDTTLWAGGVLALWPFGKALEGNSWRELQDIYYETEEE